METENKTPSINPPGLISSFTMGFNTVAGNIYLILFPLALDLLLWFGPHYRIRDLMMPALTSFYTTLTSVGTPEMKDLILATKELWEFTLERFNLVSLIRTYPVGIPSLMVNTSPLNTPIGSASIHELTSAFNAILFWGILIFIGMVAGSFYFYEVARFCDLKKIDFTIKVFLKSTLQTFLFVIILLILILLISIPTLILISVLGMISPAIAQAALFLISLFIIWLLLPLIFSPHGIFLSKQNALNAMLTSVRFVRTSMPGTSLFILALLIVSQGMNVIWQIPPETSWMMLIGIIGHAFISTSLLASSYIYYRNGILWMQQNIQQMINRGLNIK